jgi:regulation of enolase protein 1 (concanavalin A-like superfamily)
MHRWTIAVGLLLTPILAMAVPVKKDPKQSLLEKYWGAPIDPDGDCKFRPERIRLRIVVPGKPHTMAAELGQTNAPRVLREVEGDFRVEVKVLGAFNGDARCLVAKRWAFNGAGLLLWQDAKNYIRLERARIHYPSGQWRCYPNWEMRRDGKVARAGGVKDGTLDDPKPLFLRLSRKGNTITGAYSEDGKKWQELPAIQADFGKKVRVGVVALQNTPSSYEATFEGLSFVGGKSPKMH